jgi:hypothetical protein
MKALPWAIVVILALALYLSGGDNASDERAARQNAEKRAQEAAGAATSLRDSLSTLRRLRASEDSVHAAELARAQEAGRVAEAAATERAKRLRASLTAEQARELDQLEAYHAEALAEQRRATDAALSRLALAQQQAADNMTLANAEHAAAEKWEAAYVAAKAEVDELRGFSLFGLVKLGCTAGPQAGYDALDRDVAIGAGVTCGLAL